MVSRIEIDRDRCAGYENCVDEAPGVFALDSG
ncbi:MAG: 4Fe-4S single cluster domain, partial [Mycobacterium sp.]|nr:4Fe-4S single cluster domain [Mycobacterium sp.]